VDGRPAVRQRHKSPTIVHRRDSVDIGQPSALTWESIGLGLFSGLICSRSLWPSEDAAQGTGLAWCLLVILVAVSLSFVRLKRNDFRFRWSLTDTAVLTLIGLVIHSVRGALEHRAATNMALEWVTLGVAFVLFRQVPRDSRESTGLVWAHILMAFSLAGYGIFQTAVEFPAMREAYRAHPEQTLMEMGITPDSPLRRAFEDRLLQSNEAMATFALANSLASVLVGPLVILIGMMFDQMTKTHLSGNARTARLLGLSAMAMVLGLCLLWTKSRSAWIGLAAGVGLICLELLRRTRWKHVAGLVVPIALVAITLFIIGLATGRMDLLVLTESTKSLRYRVEYWVATWDVIQQGRDWLWGVGPSNFNYRYLEFKLPEASEEISDPHNVFLELWVTAGIFALVAFLVAIGWSLWKMTSSAALSLPKETEYETQSGSTDLWKMTGYSAVAFIIAPVLGSWNLFQEDLLRRWFVLLAFWGVGWLLLRWILRHSVIRPAHMAGAVVSVLVTWQATGGIGFPSVSLPFWLIVAAGANCADNHWRATKTKVIVDIKVMRFLPVAASVAAMGWFLGAAVPFWNAESSRSKALTLIDSPLPRVAPARDLLLDAIAADPMDSLSFVELAELEYQAWRVDGSKPEKFEMAWSRILAAFEKALTPPRNPLAVPVWRRQAAFIERMIRESGSRIPPAQQIVMTAQRAKCLRTASKLYPTSAVILADLAQIDAALGLDDQARKEAKKALELSEITPHDEKKLDEITARRLRVILGE
jgi:O-antigen ligase